MTSRTSIPLAERKIDYVLLFFFILNAFFITYIVDLEQVVIADPAHFSYPMWPPSFFVDMVHSYGAQYDPLLLARPPWWRMTIWIDAIFFGPFYAFAIYAFIKGRDWIRTPALVWAGMMMSNVLIILMEEAVGPHATPVWGRVLSLNIPWLLFPVVVIARLAKSPYPFTREAP